MDDTSTITHDKNLTSMDDIRRITGDENLTSDEAGDIYERFTSGDGVASAPTTGGYAMRPLTPKERNLEAARRHAGKATTATEEHKTRLYHLGHVFGHSVSGAASEHIEELDDNQSEAFRHYEQAIRTGDQERSYLQAEITSLRGDADDFRLAIAHQRALRQAVIRRAERWCRSKKMNHPVWLKDAIQLLAQEESY